MTVGLLLIDIQNEYFPGGKLELVNSEAASQAAGKLLQFFRDRRLPVFHIQHVARGGQPFFVPGTPGGEIRPVVQPLPGETLVQKHYPNAFRDTMLLRRLQEHDAGNLVIGGMATHMCVDATARAAADYGVQCRIVQDACATMDLKWGDRVVAASDVHAAFLAALHGPYGRVMPADAVIQELA